MKFITKLESFFKQRSEIMLVLSMSFIFIFFGLLKVLDISPVKDVVRESFFLFENNLFFLGLGLFEVLVGIALLFKKSRKAAAMLIVLHLLGTIFTALINPELTFSSETIVTVHGEFVAKNLILIAVAVKIFVYDEDKV